MDENKRPNRWPEVRRDDGYALSCFAAWTLIAYDDDDDEGWKDDDRTNKDPAVA